jgi:hypothetical protein
MVFRGHIRNGNVQLDEPAALREGAAVRVEVLPESSEGATEPASALPIEDELTAIWSDVSDQDWATLPADLSTNLDHYIYGAQKK